MRGIRRGSLTSACTAVALLFVTLSPAAVHAGPADTVSTAPGEDVAVGLSLLGAGGTITLPGRNAETGLRLAVPDGLTPASIRGRVSLPSYVARGTVDVYQGDRLLTRTPLPTAVGADVTIPLTGVQVDRQNRSAAIVLRSEINTNEFCAYDPSDAVRITDSQVVYSGTERRPESVGEFLPPALASLTIVIPDDVQDAEARAAVGLATAVAAHYGTAPVRITTVTRPRDAMTPRGRDGALARTIAISTSLPSGLRLTGDGASSYLTIGGPAADLAAQAAFLTSDLSPLAMSGGVIAGQMHDVPQLARDVTSLADLGVPDQRTTTGGWPRLTFGIDQTRLSRPSHNVRVQLHGTFTPPNDGGGRIVVAIGDRVIDSWPTDSSGTFDRWVSIPDDLLARYTEIAVTAEYGGVRTGCGQADLATLTLSSDGEVDADAADPPIPSGMQSLPQALMPRVQLAWTKGDTADVTRAVDIMTHLQQLTAVRLGVDVGSVADAAESSHPAVVIAADGSGLPAGLILPLASPDGTTLSVTDSASHEQRTLTSVSGVRYGSLQVTRDGDRTVLVASSTGDVASLDDLLTWMAAEPDRWSSTTGDAVVKTPDREPLFVTAASVGAAPADADHSWVYATVTVVAAVAVALIGWLLLRRRRR